MLLAGILGTFLGSLGFHQIFSADFVTVLGATAPPRAGPLIADFYFIRKRHYAAEHLDDEPDYRLAGIVSFLGGAALGLFSQHVSPPPGDLPSELLALCITIPLYLLLQRLTPGVRRDGSRSRSIPSS